VSEPERDPEWQEAAIWTKVRTPDPLRVGSLMDHEGRFMGLRVRTTGEVTAYELDRLLEYDFTTRLGRTTMRFELDDVAGSTKLRLSAISPMPLVMRPMTPFIRRSVQGMFDRDVLRLRDVVESEA
jgi:hypothetical protein